LDRYVEYKQMEAARIQPLLGAVGALPGAALVLGSEAHSAAPLFVSALTFIAAAYLFWMCTDAVFGMQYDNAVAGEEALAAHQERVGYYMSWATLLYGIVSLGCSIAGLAAMHSTLRLPISIDHGFIIAVAIFVVVAGHCVSAVALRNAQE
jgi:hypothetical protein